MRLRAFKYRIYPNPTQAASIRQSCGCRRFVYNWGLETKQKAYQQGKKLSGIDLANLLPKLKEEHVWLRDTNAQSLQSVLRDLDIAFTRFFKKQADYPRFKSKHRSKDSFHVPQHFKINQKENFMVLPKLGEVKAVIHRPFKGEAKSVTISISKSGKFFASVLVKTNEKDKLLRPVKKNKSIGLDVGLHNFVTISTGEKIPNPRNLKKAERKLVFLSKQHSKTKEGGQRRERARIKLAKQYEKVTNRRKDFLHKLTHHLVRESQATTICIEDLNIRGMMKNHKLAKAIGDVSWSEFFRMLEYKAGWEGIRIVRIGRFEPSSKLCTCGYKNDQLTLKNREWKCPECGAEHDRDVLAAENIKRFGLVRLSEEIKSGGTRRSKLVELPVSKSGAEKRESMPLKGRGVSPGSALTTV